MVGGLPFFLFVAGASGIALVEYFHLAELKGAKPQATLGIIAGFFINLAFFYPRVRAAITGPFISAGLPIPFPTQAQLFMLTLLVVIVVITLVELFRNNGSALLNLSSTIFGIVYISFFFGTFIGLRELFVPMDFPIQRYFPDPMSTTDPAIIHRVYRWGGYTVISVFAIIWICDTAAFHFGKALGKHKLFPRVSPNKSWEGAIFGFIFAILTAIAVKYIVLDYLSIGSAVIIGVIVGIFGQLGDLIESLLKRDAGVKDSSTLIPGHGGVFDRFDSLLLVSPLVYLYIDYILLS